MVNPVPVGHSSTARIFRFTPQTRWMRSAQSTAISLRSADSSRATSRAACSMATFSRPSSYRPVARAAAAMPIPRVASDPRAVQDRGVVATAQVVQPPASSQDVARVARVRPARRCRSPAAVWPSAPTAPTVRAQAGGMWVAAPMAATA